MNVTTIEPAAGHSSRRAGPGVIRRNLLAWLAGGALTVAVEIGVLLAAMAAMPSDAAAVVALVAGLVWTMIAAPVFAAGADRPLDAFLRGAGVADAGAVVLIAVTFATDALSLGGAVGAYLLWMAVALACSGLCAIPPRRETRHIVAAAVVVVMLVVSAGPFWANGLLMAAPQGRPRRAVATVVVAANPVFALSQTFRPQVGFVWNERPILYEYTVLGRDIPRPTPGWPVTALAYAAVAVLAGGAAVIGRRR